jgi:hypothetical protein
LNRVSRLSPHRHRDDDCVSSSQDRRDACPTQTIIVPSEEVLNIVRRLVESRRRGDETPFGQSLLTSAPAGEFTTAEIYAFERELGKPHPGATEGNQGNKVWKPFHCFVPSVCFCGSFMVWRLP